MADFYRLIKSYVTNYNAKSITMSCTNSRERFFNSLTLLHETSSSSKTLLDHQGPKNPQRRSKASDCCRISTSL